MAGEAHRQYMYMNIVPTCGLISAGSVFCPAVKLDDLVNLFLSSVKASLSISSCVSE